MSVVVSVVAHGRAALRRRRDARSDRGTTMVELAAAMALMSIVGAIFVGAAITLNRTTSAAQALTSTATSLNQAFLSLDRTVRYANTISTPGRSAGSGATTDWYVELRDTRGSSALCTQIRLDIATSQLQRRTWTSGNLATLTPFVQIAVGFVNGDAAVDTDDQPFALKKRQPTVRYQQLDVRLTATSGPASSPRTSRSAFGFTALNSTVPVTGSTCQEAGRP